MDLDAAITPMHFKLRAMRSPVRAGQVAGMGGRRAVQAELASLDAWPATHARRTHGPARYRCMAPQVDQVPYLGFVNTASARLPDCPLRVAVVAA